MNDLSKGEHHLTLKVWDNLNNSSTESITFNVTDSSQLKIRDVYNAPNPMEHFTNFYFEHNQAGSELDITIRIFSLSGRLVKQIQRTMYSGGYRIGPIPSGGWRGISDSGGKIPNGIYIYRIIVRSNKKVTQKAGKLIIQR